MLVAHFDVGIRRDAVRHLAPQREEILVELKVGME